MAASIDLKQADAARTPASNFLNQASKRVEIFAEPRSSSDCRNAGGSVGASFGRTTGGGENVCCDRRIRSRILMRIKGRLMSSLSDTTQSPLWAKRWLWAAGIYNLIWGTMAIIWPHLLYDLAGAERLNYPEVWQCVGMIVGVYGIGYLIAAGESRRHWPIVLVGLCGKVLGPVGFLIALLRGTFPPLFGLTILTNDLIWWVPFGMILRDARNFHGGTPPLTAHSPQQYVKQTRIHADPAVVFRFHESPGALQHLIPPWENIKLVESAGSLQVGSRVVLRGHLGLFPLQWIAIHTEYDPPHLFADRQESGPFALWYHRHRFLEDGFGGTILRDEIEYAVPFGRLGHWLGGALIRRQLERMFAYRHETTRRLIESKEWTSETR
jgi:ligand-binding SRPBCC domain-containing protein